MRHGDDAGTIPPASTGALSRPPNTRFSSKLELGGIGLLPRLCAFEIRVETFRPRGGWGGHGPGTLRSERRPSTAASEPAVCLKVRGEPYSGKEIQSLTVKSRPRSTDRGSRPSRSVGGLGGSAACQPPLSRAPQARFEPRSVGRPGFQRFHAPSRSVGLGRLSHPHNGPSLGRSVGPTSLSTVLL